MNHIHSQIDTSKSINRNPFEEMIKTNIKAKQSMQYFEFRERHEKWLNSMDEIHTEYLGENQRENAYSSENRIQNSNNTLFEEKTDFPNDDASAVEDNEQVFSIHDILYTLKIKETFIKEPRELYDFKVEPKWPKNMKKRMDHPNIIHFDSNIGNNFQRQYSDHALSEYSKDINTLTFESDFECGNLKSAKKIGDSEYKLKLRPDLYTSRYTQWFYFRIKNIKKNLEYRFHISNLMKSNCLYAHGMRPVMYSEKMAKYQHLGWQRFGYDISYGTKETNSRLNTLSFSATFEYDDDIVYFAHSYPYSYSDLQLDIKRLKSDTKKSKYIKHRIMGKSLAGNNVDILTITASCESIDELNQRRGIILSSRVHPGESNSSWMMNGFIDFITSEDPKSDYLRRNFIFKIVPMLNPDGVIVGNHRCGLSGHDFNRKYNMDLQNHSQGQNSPEIKAMLQMIEKMASEREIAFYCDFHGHNRKFGAFMYGCSEKGKDSPERVFPYLLCKNSLKNFIMKNCRFKIDKEKNGSGRIVLRKKFNIINSFTLEGSLCGNGEFLKGERVLYEINDYKGIGKEFGWAMHEYFKSENV